MSGQSASGPGPGRPRVLDDVKRGQVAALVAAGCSVASIARFVGCSINTVRREIARDPAFQDQIRRAEIHAQLDPLQAMRRASATHWRAAAWLLERTQPEQFGRKPPGFIGPDELRRVVDEIIQTATDDIEDDGLRRQIVESLQNAAAAASPLLRDEAPSDPLMTPSEESLKLLFEQIDRDRRQAVRDVMRSVQNRPDFASRADRQSHEPPRISPAAA